MKGSEVFCSYKSSEHQMYPETAGKGRGHQAGGIPGVLCWFVAALRLPRDLTFIASASRTQHTFILASGQGKCWWHSYKDSREIKSV